VKILDVTTHKDTKTTHLMPDRT